MIVQLNIYIGACLKYFKTLCFHGNMTLFIAHDVTSPQAYWLRLFFNKNWIIIYHNNVF